MMQKNSKILITGHSGLLGNALQNHLADSDYKNIISCSSKDVNLLNQNQTETFFDDYKPEYVFHCAAKAGGIKANIEKPFDFINENLSIQTNCINAALKNKVKKFLFVSSTCVYPKNVNQPMKEEDILSGQFVNDLQPYCISKVAGMEQIKAINNQLKLPYISVLLPNLYGAGDHYGDDSNHVIPALIEKFVKSKLEKRDTVEIWGSGLAIREFLNTKDAAEGLHFLMMNYNSDLPINLSSKTNVSIRQLATKIAEIISYQGNLIFDETKPEGAPKKVSDNTKINALGWESKISLKTGLKDVVEDYINNYHKDISFSQLIS